MIHRIYSTNENWEWHTILQDPDVSQTSSETMIIELYELRNELPNYEQWLAHSLQGQINKVEVSRIQDGTPVLYGTLMLQHQGTIKDWLEPIHYYVHPSKIITVYNGISLPLNWKNAILRCQSSAEAFCVLLGLLIEPLHNNLNEFQLGFAEIERLMKRANNSQRVAVTTERRVHLLHLHQRLASYQEALHAGKEAFTEQITNTIEFKSVLYKLERIDTILNNYSRELDAFTTWNDSSAAYKSRKWMKGIGTILAVLSGVLWVITFTHLPSLDPSWRYLLFFVLIMSLLSILIFSLLSSKPEKKPADLPVRLPDRVLPHLTSNEDIPPRLSAKGAARLTSSKPDSAAKGRSRRSDRPYRGSNKPK